jgi:hypothetical protein
LWGEKKKRNTDTYCQWLNLVSWYLSSIPLQNMAENISFLPLIQNGQESLEPTILKYITSKE